jgi:hypothetical protein
LNPVEAIRKIVLIKDNLLTVALPDSYNGKQVELIILPASEASEVAEEKADYYTKFFGSMKSSLSPKELDDKIKSLREEWNRDLS